MGDELEADFERKVVDLEQACEVLRTGCVAAGGCDGLAGDVDIGVPGGLRRQLTRDEDNA